MIAGRPCLGGQVAVMAACELVEEQPLWGDRLQPVTTPAPTPALAPGNCLSACLRNGSEHQWSIIICSSGFQTQATCTFSKNQ